MHWHTNTTPDLHSCHRSFAWAVLELQQVPTHSPKIMRGLVQELGLIEEELERRGQPVQLTAEAGA